jgi:hypothetical protein
MSDIASGTIGRGGSEFQGEAEAQRRVARSTGRLADARSNKKQKKVDAQGAAIYRDSSSQATCSVTMLGIPSPERIRVFVCWSNGES